MFARRLLALQKGVKLSEFRRPMSENHGGVPGLNTPIPKCVGNPVRCTITFILFFGSGFWVPCIALTYLMYKA